jgi:hypothetical protein
MIALPCPTCQTTLGMIAPDGSSLEAGPFTVDHDVTLTCRACQTRTRWYAAEPPPAYAVIRRARTRRPLLVIPSAEAAA